MLDHNHFLMNKWSNSMLDHNHFLMNKLIAILAAIIKLKKISALNEWILRVSFS